MKEKYYEAHGSPHLKSPTSPLPPHFWEKFLKNPPPSPNSPNFGKTHPPLLRVRSFPIRMWQTMVLTKKIVHFCATNDYSVSSYWFLYMPPENILSFYVFRRYTQTPMTWNGTKKKKKNRNRKILYFIVGKLN